MTEGNRFVVSGIELEGYFLGRDDEFKALITVKAGQTYNAGDVSLTTKAFTDYFGNFGFAFARVETRTEIDIKGFARRWVMDSHSWTPLDVKDKLNLALRVVEPKAREVVRKGLRIAQRKALIDRGVSGRVVDVVGDPSRQPQILIQSRKPLSVMVAFDTTLILPDGNEEPGGRVLFTLFLKEVPRTPDNMAGLTIIDGTFPENL